MASYFVDDGGSATAPYDTWAKAAVSLQALDAAVAFASGDIIYIGHDSVGTDAGAALTITGPASGAPVIIISSTHVSGSAVAYQQSVTDQVKATGATSDIALDGSFACYGVRFAMGRNFIWQNDANETGYANECTFALGADGGIVNQTAGTALAEMVRCIFDLTADGSSSRTNAVFQLTSGAASFRFNGGSFVNPGFRTGSIFTSTVARVKAVGLNMDGFPSATEWVAAASSNAGILEFIGCKKTSGASVLDAGTRVPALRVSALNCGNTDDPSAIEEYGYTGEVVSTRTIYRQNGASPEGVGSSWLVVTSAACTEGSPFYTPWMVVPSTAGVRTFSVAITNDTIALKDSEAWIDVRYMASSGSNLLTATSDRRVITDSAVDQTTDAVSSWTGTGPAFTYLQTLSKQVTVAEPGQVMVRVGFGKASILAASNLYVDPLVSIS